MQFDDKTRFNSLKPLIYLGNDAYWTVLQEPQLARSINMLREELNISCPETHAQQLARKLAATPGAASVVDLTYVIRQFPWIAISEMADKLSHNKTVPTNTATVFHVGNDVLHHYDCALARAETLSILQTRTSGQTTTRTPT